jgi:hypothetical protein
MEIRSFSGFIKNVLKSNINLYIMQNYANSTPKICFRCKLEDADSVKIVCLNCCRARYCSEKCKKLNDPLHGYLCTFYTQNNPVIKELMKNMIENFENTKKD